jgi:hypothetical protein
VIELLLQAERALTLGLLDQAERLYRQTIAADPRNSIAVVGLARVALERGDEAGALWHARRALVIDPDNPAARRLVDRMVEVITRRGDAVPNGAGPAGASPPAAEPPPKEASPPSGASRPGGASSPSGDPSGSEAASPSEVSQPAKRRGLVRRLLGRG